MLMGMACCSSAMASFRLNPYDPLGAVAMGVKRAWFCCPPFTHKLDLGEAGQFGGERPCGSRVGEH